MTDPVFPDQEHATLNLMMHREVDKRVLVAVYRALDPYPIGGTNGGVHELERKFDHGDMQGVKNMMIALFVQVLMSDGSMMHQIRSKLSEHLNKHY